MTDVRAAGGHDEVRRDSVGPGLWNALKAAGADWLAHKSPKAGASLAYYSVFSMGPLIVVVISIASLVLEREGVQHSVVGALTGLLGNKGGEGISTMLQAAGKPSEGIFAAVIGTATLVFAALGVVVQLKEALNTVWEVKPKPHSGIWGFVREYVLSLAGVAALGFLLLVSLLVTAGLAAAGKVMGNLFPEAIMEVLNFVVSFAVIAVMFALLFKWMPDADVAWRDVALGAVGTAALFEIGRFAIGFYVAKQDWNPPTAPRLPSWWSLSGSTTARRSCCSARSSHTCGRRNGAAAKVGQIRKTRLAQQPARQVHRHELGEEAAAGQNGGGSRNRSVRGRRRRAFPAPARRNGRVLP